MEAAMLLLPSSTEGIYALLMAPGTESLLATVKYTIPDKNTSEIPNQADLTQEVLACQYSYTLELNVLNPVLLWSQS